MLIIDAYNVLHANGVLPPHLAGIDLPGLIQLLSTSRYARRRITLVCDGGTPGLRSGARIEGVCVLYSGHTAEADDLIETLLEKYHRGNPLEMVSSDRRLRKAARRVGAGVIRSDDFLARLTEDEAKPKSLHGNALRRQVPLDAYSVRAWCREFGVPESPVPAATGTAIPAPRQAKPKKPRRQRPPTEREPALGQPLDVRLPVSEPSPDRADAPAASSRTDDPAGLDEIDPLVLRALEEWRDRLDLDDLDMRRWMPDADPL